jgi:hypothetical protein
MRRITAAAMALSMGLSAAPLMAAQAATGTILGTAKTSAGKTVANTTVRLRDLATNQLSGTTMSNGSGAFGFTGLQAGNYVIEVVNAAGEIIGTSASVAVAAGAAVTGVTVTAAAVGAAAVGGGLGTVAITSIVVAAGAGTVATVVAVKSDASPSK